MLGTLLEVPPGTNPSNAEPLNFALLMGWEGPDLGRLAAALAPTHANVARKNAALRVASENDDAEAVEALISSGAHPDAGDEPKQVRSRPLLLLLIVCNRFTPVLPRHECPHERRIHHRDPAHSSRPATGPLGAGARFTSRAGAEA